MTVSAWEFWVSCGLVSSAFVLYAMVDFTGYFPSSYLEYQSAMYYFGMEYSNHVGTRSQAGMA